MCDRLNVENKAELSARMRGEFIGGLRTKGDAQAHPGGEKIKLSGNVTVCDTPFTILPSAWLSGFFRQHNMASEPVPVSVARRFIYSLVSFNLHFAYCFDYTKNTFPFPHLPQSDYSLPKP